MSRSTGIEWCDPLNWGNRVVCANGYVLVRCPSYPNAKPNGYVFEHRLTMATLLGRPLESHEVVHHINFVRNDNRIENLALTTQSKHTAGHQAERSSLVKRALAFRGLVAYAKRRRLPRTTVKCACGCGMELITPDSQGRFHRYIQGHNQTGRRWRRKRAIAT